MGLSRRQANRAIAGGHIVVGLATDKKAQKDVFEMLKELGTERKLKSAVRAGLKKAIKPVLADAIANAPVLTGKLRASLKAVVVSGRRSRRGLYIQKVVTGTREELGIDKDSKWYYPAIVHAGHDRAEARPFMREAADANRERSVAIFWEHIQRYILKLLRGRPGAGSAARGGAAA